MNAPTVLSYDTGSKNPSPSSYGQKTCSCDEADACDFDQACPISDGISVLFMSLHPCLLNCQTCRVDGLPGRFAWKINRKASQHPHRPHKAGCCG